MDELVELLKFLLVIDFLGNRRDGPQAVHDVVLNKHGSIAAHGEGDGIARTRIDPMLVAVGQNNDRRIEHGRLGTDNLDALEFCIQGIKRVEQQVMGDRALGTTAVDTAANSRSLKRISWIERERSGAGESDLLQRSRSTISDGTGPAAMTMVSMSTRTMEHLRYVAVNTRRLRRIE